MACKEVQKSVNSLKKDYLKIQMIFCLNINHTPNNKKIQKLMKNQ